MARFCFVLSSLLITLKLFFKKTIGKIAFYIVKLAVSCYAEKNKNYAAQPALKQAEGEVYMGKNLETAFSTRQYMQTKDFELFYYSDRHLKQVKNHTHTYYEFYFFLEGKVVMEIDGRPYALTYGDVILIPPGIVHHASITENDRPYRRFVFWISREYFDSLTACDPAYAYLLHRAQTEQKYIFHNDMIAFHAIQSKVFGLIEEMQAARFGKAEKISLYTRDLILQLNRVAYEKEHPKQQKGEQTLYQNLISYIDEHLDEDLSLDALAKHFFVSKYYIAHLCKDNIGYSLHQYILKKRLDACKNAISGGAGIGSVFLLYGFKDYSSFYRAFKKEYGMSPKEYRQQYSKLLCPPE